jgi:hypothetical protein
LLTSCTAFASCACVFSGNFLRAAQRPCMSTCLAGPGVIFQRAGALRATFVSLGASVSTHASCSPCTYSEATACICHSMCTAVSSDQIRSSHSIIMHICFIYPACLIFLIHVEARYMYFTHTHTYIYVILHVACSVSSQVIAGQSIGCWVAACPSELPALAHISSAPPVICPSATNNAGILTSYIRKNRHAGYMKCA